MGGRSSIYPKNLGSFFTTSATWEVPTTYWVGRNPSFPFCFKQKGPRYGPTIQPCLSPLLHSALPRQSPTEACSTQLSDLTSASWFSRWPMDTYPRRRLGTDQPRYPGSDCHAFQESLCRGFPGGSVVENPSANAGDAGLTPGPGRFHMLQSCWAHGPQLPSLCSRARELPLLSSHAAATEARMCLETVLRNQRSHCNEKPKTREEYRD